MQITLLKISSIADPNAAVYVAKYLDHVKHVCEMIGTTNTIWSKAQLKVIGDRAAKGELNYHDDGHTVTLSLKDEPVADYTGPYYVVCEVICQTPAVSVHLTEEAAIDQAVRCAMENLYVAEDPEDPAVRAESRAGFRDQLTEDDSIRAGDYEVYILTPR